jgi:hypothetical protein
MRMFHRAVSTTLVAGVAVLCLATGQPAWSAVLGQFGDGIYPTAPEQLIYDGPNGPGSAGSACPASPVHVASPDMAVRAFRDAQGHIQLVNAGAANRRTVINSFSDLPASQQCTPVLIDGRYPQPPDGHTTDINYWRPSEYNDVDYLASVYPAPDGNLVALLHEEYHADGYCPQFNLPLSYCGDRSVTSAVASNNAPGDPGDSDPGSNYRFPSPPPGHLIATVPYQYETDWGDPAHSPPGPGEGPGYIQPTQIVHAGDGYYYVMFSTNSQGFRDQQPGTCVMRTPTLSAQMSPSDWQVWGDKVTNDPDSIPHWGETSFVNPYNSFSGQPGDHVCTPVSGIDSRFIVRSLTYSTFWNKFMVIGSVNGDIRYSLSGNLTNWAPPAQMPISSPDLGAHLVDDPRDGCGNLLTLGYPTVIDPSDTSTSFQNSDSRVDLYVSKAYYDSNCQQLLQDGDLFRVPIRFRPIRSASGHVVCSPGGFDQHHYVITPNGFTTTNAVNYGGDSGAYVATLGSGSTFAEGVFSKDLEPQGFGGQNGCIQDWREPMSLASGDEIWYRAAFKFPTGSSFWTNGQGSVGRPSVTILSLDNSRGTVPADRAGAVSIGSDDRIHFTTQSASGSSVELLKDSSGQDGVPVSDALTGGSGGKNDCWHLFEVYQKLAASGAQNMIWIDGVLQNQQATQNARGTANYYGTPVDRIRAGIVGTSTPRDTTQDLSLYTDDVTFNHRFTDPLSQNTPYSGC